ncbi:hypothetical protein [Dyadobacter diqingensis]|uniref:hypothetical protein n=1 Tax=Dyadobacter diqingensis TaxID=2938121 RepID=UPI0020C4FD88|nr:hypothetical protein [Dyadobacter diqingensis]
MIKTISLIVPRHVKKFILSEEGYRKQANAIYVPKRSELGEMIFAVSNTISYTQIFEERQLPNGSEWITFEYNSKKKSFDVPVEKYKVLECFLVEHFRGALIKEVAAIHYVHPNDDYSWMVRSFLTRRGIVTDDAGDKDIDWETVRKIYRDYLDVIQKKNRENRQLSQPVLSGLQPFRRI